MGSCSIFNGRVGMTVTDNEIYRIIVDIMDIQNEPENIFELDNWIRQIGLQEVYKKIIQIYSINLMYRFPMRNLFLLLQCVLYYGLI